MKDLSSKGFATKAIHAGQEPDPTYGTLATPIYQTSTFCFENVEEGADKFAGKVPGFVYSRGGNPTVAAFEKKMAVLECGEAAVAAASGIGAIGAIMTGLLKAGDHIIAGDCVYGGTSVILRDCLPNFGIEITFVDTGDINAIAAAVKDNTKMIYVEAVTNPMMQVADIKGIAAIAKQRDIKLVVDNTFAPPPIQTPLTMGADIVVHSVTKYLNGHGDVIGGVVVGSAEDIGKVKKLGITKLCGSVMSPFNAFLVLRGLQTLELRMTRHHENAMKLTEYLETVPYVSKVYFPGLESDSYHKLAKEQMNDMYPGIFSLELKEGIAGMSAFEAGKKFVNALEVSHIAVSLGDPSSLVEHPASMTHASVPKEAREAAGITDGLIRYSAGLETIEDLIADFKQAFEKLEAAE